MSDENLRASWIEFIKPAITYYLGLPHLQQASQIASWLQLSLSFSRQPKNIDHTCQRWSSTFNMSTAIMWFDPWLEKIAAMYQPIADIASSEPRISVYGQKLKVAKMFVDLGSTENITNTIDDKIALRMKKRVTLSDNWIDICGLMIECRLIQRWNVIILDFCLHYCMHVKTWITYRWYVKRLQRFYHHCLHRIFNICR